MSPSVKKALHVLSFIIGVALVAITALAKEPGLAWPAGVALWLSEARTVLSVAKAALAGFAGVALLAVGLVLANSACSGAQVKQAGNDVVDCTKGALGNAVKLAGVYAADDIVHGATPHQIGDQAKAAGIAVGWQYAGCVLAAVAAEFSGRTNGQPIDAPLAEALQQEVDAFRPQPAVQFLVLGRDGKAVVR
jgi:hypothetical protein